MQRAIHKEKGKQPALSRWASSVVREKVSSLVIAESSAVHGSYRVRVRCTALSEDKYADESAKIMHGRPGRNILSRILFQLSETRTRK